MADVADNRLFDLLPDTGYYCVQRNGRWDEAKKRWTKIHTWYTDKLAMASDLLAFDKRTTEVWYGIATYIQTGSRKRTNLHSIKCMALDVDVKPGSKKHYSDKAEAGAALVAAIGAGLPRPSYVVESTNGFHVYWVFDYALDAVSWQTIADTFVAFTQKIDAKLIADVTTSRSPERVLRWPGTHNKKDPANPGGYSLNPFLVSIVSDTGTQYLPEEFGRLIGTNLISGHRAFQPAPAYVTGLLPKAPPVAGAMPMSVPLMASRIPMDQELEVIKRCGAMSELEYRVGDGYDKYNQTQNPGDMYHIEEPGWLAMLSILKYFGERGKTYAHALSKASQRYDEGAFEAKWQHAGNNINTYGCSKFCRDAGLDPVDRSYCHGCPAFELQGKAYAQGTEKHDTCPADLEAQEIRATTVPQQVAAAPVQFFATDGLEWAPMLPPTTTVALPDTGILTVEHPVRQAPQPNDFTVSPGFWYLLSNALSEYAEVNAEVQPARKAGEPKMVERKIVPLLRRMTWPIAKTMAIGDDGTGGYAYLMGAVKAENGKPREFYEYELTANEIADKKPLATALFRNGIEVIGDDGTALQRVRRFFDRVKDRSGDKVLQLPTGMGWTEQKTFNLGHLHITPTSIERARYFNVSDMVLGRFTRAGDPEQSMDAFGYMFEKATDDAKVFILGSLATPLFSLLEGAGENSNPIVNLAGRQSTAKSLTLAVAQSVWGTPDARQLMEKSTYNSALNMFSKHRNLPVLFDEMSNYKDKDDLASIITTFAQGTPKTAQTDVNKERKGVSPWACALLSTSNDSLHHFLIDHLGSGFTALGKMRRVLEIQVLSPLFGANDPEIDRARDTLKSNYGYIGATFIQHVVRNYGRVHDMMYAARDKEKVAMGDDNTGSFYGTYCAGVNVVAQLLEELGIMSVPASWLERASQSFKSASMTKIAETKARADDLLRRVRDMWAGYTYKFRIDRYGQETAVNNDMQKLGKMNGPGSHARIRYVEDHSGANVVERFYIHRDEFEGFLRRSNIHIDGVRQRWADLGYRVMEVDCIIDQGAAPSLALGAGNQNTSSFGATAVPCIVVEIDLAAPSMLP